MMFVNFWDYILSPAFLVTFGLLMLPFLILLVSVWITWVDNAPGEEEE